MVEMVKNNLVINNIPVFLMTSMPVELFKQEQNLDQYLDLAKELISKTDDTLTIIDRVKEIISDEYHQF